MPDQPGAVPPQGLGRSERIVAVAAIVLTVCLIAILISFANIVRVHAEVTAEVENTRAIRRAVLALVQASIDAETGQRGFLLTGEPAFLEPYDDGRRAALTHLAQLREVTRHNTDLQAGVARADDLALLAFEQLAQPIDLRQRGRLNAQELREELFDSKATMDALRDEAQVLLTQSETLLTEARGRETETNNRLYWLGGAMTLLTGLGLAITFWTIYSERQAWRRSFVALEEAREAAAASDLAKTRFLAVASHDMRQPLHALTLYLSALERRVDNEEARGILQKMERATDSMITMFSTLLDLARIQAGVVNPEITAFALQDVFERIAAENGADVAVEPTSITLYSDAALIERALRNLVANAIKHGGGKARLSARETGDRAEIVVADNGPGISEADQERIFDEFVRIERRGVSSGLGLGLSIVQGIGAALDMPIEVQSELGRGARFILRPRLSAVSVAATNAESEFAALDGAATLVVDDDALAREAVARALGDMGAQLRTAGNEAEAEAQLADGFAPRLLVMDLRIDGELQGVEIARRLCARFASPPRVIIITGDTAADTLAMLRTSGFAWLIKPVSPRDLGHMAVAQLAAAA